MSSDSSAGRFRLQWMLRAAAALAVLGAWSGELAAGAPPVVVEESAREPIVRTVSITGTVTSPRTAMLSPSVGGLISDFHVDDGDFVDVGDLLVQLDPELESMALEQARAARIEVRVALDDARRRLTEAERLGRDRGVAETEIKSLQAEVAMDESALEAAEIAVRRQQAVLDRHRIGAPFDGVVSQRVAEIGEWVNPGDVLLELVATDGLRFDFQVPQEYFPQIDRDTGISLRLDADPDTALDGKIRAIIPVSNPGERTFLLRAVADDDHLPSITPGMSARAILRIGTGREAVVVPRDALLRYPDGRTTIWVVIDGDNGPTVSEQLVQTGLAFDGKIEIRSGLEGGVRVVTRGNEALRQGQTVSLH